MADALIETVDQNPYGDILNNVTSQLSELNENISKVTSAINSLEKLSPNSPVLSQLRERLNSLQTQKEQLWNQQTSAASMMASYDSASQRLDTLKGIYDLKQQQLAKQKAESDIAYDMMYEDTKNKWDNYINALWQAQASEDAIINANAWRMWQGMQSVAETRARNYLANARQQNEAALSNQQLLNDIRSNKINNDNALFQMWSADADNYLRQQVLTDQELAENERNRQFQKEMQDAQIAASRGGGWSSSSSLPRNLLQPNDTKMNNPNYQPVIKVQDWEVIDPYLIQDEVQADQYEKAYWPYANARLWEGGLYVYKKKNQ